ncbi:NAD-dependent epimerase/dehydratase family protein [Streptomyces palmae]|uniref:NAD-dependent epimerase/dehydratase family protein n=1 Tax=Streptomyces palmae TaxID=1701085 RepID=A0A4Z0HG19_9ACTN|nr:NAD-dependent epimerase/dehydratase family protein [Streptomyces palmae]TGB16172.1 NAD-dependent epimerase/dehydratase family protein [Streptomyces palmae]
MRRICVIGGSRYFGKRLTTRFLAAGIEVTVVNRGSAPAPAGAVHLVADRDDEASLNAALGDRAFDVVVDQVCYTPRQADIARRVFADRTRRYLMTSTVEVYDRLHTPDLVREDAVDPAGRPVDLSLPWDDPAFLDAHYGEGKRQAEAVFTKDAAFDFLSVRTAHVLGGADDFTGRLAHYAERIGAEEPVGVPADNHPATYIHVEEIADFLFWAAGAEFTGPINACSHGELSTADICAAVAERIGGKPPEYRTVPGAEASPFSFERHYGMDNSRATGLGFTFSHSGDWLARAVAETLGKQDH